MGDITCRVCQEPADAHHFRFDADYDLGEDILAKLAERFDVTLPEGYPWQSNGYDPQPCLGLAYKGVIAGLGCDCCQFPGLSAPVESNEDNDMAFLESIEECGDSDADEIITAIHEVLS